MVHIDSQLLAMFSGLVVPLLVGLLTKSHASAGVKSALNAGLTAIAGALTTALAAGGSVNWQVYVFNIGLAWVISIATYYGLYKPTGTAAAVQSSTGGFGFGGPSLAAGLSGMTAETSGPPPAAPPELSTPVEPDVAPPAAPARAAVPAELVDKPPAKTTRPARKAAKKQPPRRPRA